MRSWTLYLTESLELLRLNYHHLNAIFLNPSALLLLSYVRVTAGSSTFTRPASLQAWQMFSRTVEWHHTHSVEHLFQCPACSTQLTTQVLWDDPDAVADFLKLDDNWQKEGSCGLQQLKICDIFALPMNVTICNQDFRFIVATKMMLVWVDFKSCCWKFLVVYTLYLTKF